MGRSQHPLIGDEDSGTVKDLLRTTKKSREKRPIARRWLHTTHYPLLDPQVPVNGTSTATGCNRIDRRASRKGQAETSGGGSRREFFFPFPPPAKLDSLPDNLPYSEQVSWTMG